MAVFNVQPEGVQSLSDHQPARISAVVANPNAVSAGSSTCSGTPVSCRSRQSAWGRDLPDTDGLGFVSLNGRFRETYRSLIGQDLPVGRAKCLPQSRRLRLALDCPGPDLYTR
jgi:hypothetical protein